MNNDDLSIENRLKDFRKSRELSQVELAEKLGISRQSIIALEQGRFMPSLPLAFSICRFFDSTIEDLFEFGQELEKEVDQIFNNNKINIKIVHPESLSDNSLPRPQEAEKENSMSSEMEPWRPFREVVSLRDAMDRLFEDSVITPTKAGGTMPKIDIKDLKDKVVVKAELPGMAEDQINVEISDNVMTISGEKVEEKEKEDEGYYYKESHSGSFSRSFSLPSEVVSEKAEAEMKNGVLTISLPKIEPKKATRLKIAKK
jgi:HSP20 family protein